MKSRRVPRSSSFVAAALALACARGPAHPEDASAVPASASASTSRALPPPALPAIAASATAAPSPGPAAPSQPGPTAELLASLHAGSARTVSGRAGVVVTSEANATHAGIAALERGGNAADAIVAAAYTLAVTYPSAGNLGGGGVVLYRPKGGPTVAIEFRERAPGAVTQAAFDRMIAEHAVGPAAAGVPGSVAGLDLTLARFGRLGRAEALQVAIRLAKDGFPLGHNQAQALGWVWPTLSKDPQAKRVFGDGKGPKHEGARVVQPELAATLERIAKDGDAGFYTGTTAEQLAALSERGGLISREDLASYHAVVREPLRTTYRGFSIETSPPPAGGGAALGATLAMLEKREAWRYPALSADELHLFAEAARRAQTIRRFDVVDPDSVPGYDLARNEASWLDAGRLFERLGPIDMTHATPSKGMHPLYDAAVKELEHTTHLAAVDGDGNVATLTTTLSASFGARVMAAGMVLNDSLAAFGTAGAATPLPGRRMPTSMSPTLVLANGEPVLVLGSPGGDTIPNTVARVLRNAIDYGMSIDVAVDAPRIHHGFVPDEIRFESGHPPPKGVLAELARRGHRLSSKTHAIGDANSIAVAGGVAYAYADPRGGGLALAATPKTTAEKTAAPAKPAQ
ncbi:MAG TPA: gamma-glutamyltransferase [Polyangiaceae bacterium]|nr:gamma-glutamyltransferase [Polyangiaceae bacterium]